jgi:hypothetical protein
LKNSFFRREKNTLYESVFSVNGSAVGHGGIIYFAQKIYIRRIHSNVECYYNNSATILNQNFTGFGIVDAQNNFPVSYVNNNDIAANINFQTISNGIKRLSGEIVYRPEPLGVWWIEIGRISSNVTINISYFL